MEAAHTAADPDIVAHPVLRMVVVVPAANNLLKADQVGVALVGTADNHPDNRLVAGTAQVVDSPSHTEAGRRLEG